MRSAPPMDLPHGPGLSVCDSAMFEPKTGADLLAVALVLRAARTFSQQQVDLVSGHPSE